VTDRHTLGSRPGDCMECFDYRASKRQSVAAGSAATLDSVTVSVLKQLIFTFDGAMATEHVDPEVRRRVINLLLVGVTDPNVVIEVPNGGH